MSRGLFAGLLALVCVSVLVTTPAIAQPAPIEPRPPEFPSIDDNGVDLTSGALQLQRAQVSVGDVSDGGLARSGLDFEVRDNYTGGIAVNILEYYVSLGPVTEKFYLNPLEGDIKSVSGTGRLVHDQANSRYIYTLSDGTEVIFDAAISNEYGPNGLISSLTRPDGEKLTYIYTDYSTHPSCGGQCKRLQAITTNRGYMLKYEYAGSTLPASRRLSRVVALNLSYEYCEPMAASCSLTGPWSQRTFSGQDFNNGTFTSTDSLQRTTAFTVTAGRITQIVSPMLLTTTIGYDTNGRVHTVSSPAGTWTYTYGSSGGDLVTTVTDPASHVTAYVVDATWNRVKAVTDATGRTTSYEIDPNTGRVVAVISPESNRVNYGYNDRGLIGTVTRVAKTGSPTPLPDYVTTYSYPPSCTLANAKICNKPIAITEAGATTDYTYSATHGGVLTVTSPAGVDGVRPKSTYSYSARSAAFLNSSGALVAGPAIQKLIGVSQCAVTATCAYSSTELVQSYGYAATTVPNNLRPSQSSVNSNGGALASVTQFTYTKAGDLETTDGPLASPIIDTAARRYNSERQLVGEIEIDPDGAGAGRRAIARKYSYRADGQLDWMELGSVASQTDTGWAGFTANERVTYGYDGAGRETSRTLSAAGVARTLTQTSYDLAGRVECVAVRMNPTAFATAPASACVAGAEGAAGPDRITKYAYDDAGRRTGVISAFGTDAGRSETTTYTLSGAVHTLSDGKGNVTTYQYDGFDRLWKTTLPPPAIGVASPYTEITYDNATWRVQQVRLRDGTLVNYTYDARGNMVSKSAPNTTYVYDNFDRVRSVTGNGQTITTTYDGIGRHTGTTGPHGTVGYGYNLAYQRISTTWPDSFYVNYVLDWTGAMTAIRQLGQSTGPGLLATFAYDDLGRRTSVARGNGVVTTYGYDAQSRLETLIFSGTDKSQTLTFGHNAGGQITSRTSNNAAYAWNELHNVARPYAVNGLNQLTASGSSGISYDPRGNLSSDGVTGYTYDVENHLTGISSGASIAYDPLGRLYQTTSSGGTVTRFLYDGPDLIAEYSSSGAVLRRFVHGPGSDEPLVWFEGASYSSTGSDRRWLIADHQGSIVAITNGAGVATTVNKFDEHGIHGQNNFGRFQYTGQAWIPDFDIYHYKARAYSPELGRFLQPDPIGYGDGLNMYVYVRGDPVNFADPSGLDGSGPAAEDLEEVVVFGTRIDFDAIRRRFDDGSRNIGRSVGNIVEEVVVTAAKRTASVRRNCPIVAQGEASFGLQGAVEAGVPAAKGGITLDAGTFRYSYDFVSHKGSWRLTQEASVTGRLGVETVGLGGTQGVERAGAVGRNVPRNKALANQPFRRKQDTFFGVEFSVAAMSGLMGKVGLENLPQCVEGFTK